MLEAEKFSNFLYLDSKKIKHKDFIEKLIETKKIYASTIKQIISIGPITYILFKDDSVFSLNFVELIYTHCKVSDIRQIHHGIDIFAEDAEERLNKKAAHFASFVFKDEVKNSIVMATKIIEACRVYEKDILLTAKDKDKMFIRFDDDSVFGAAFGVFQYTVTNVDDLKDIRKELESGEVNIQ